ncbi:DinB family protein [Anatilimnocola floriformis]|uniref:DinB family protein n=1 Tax=Anatilimnocola floriformis TaxID=2948575 RepID=UPI0020C55823|nr:DinB family protein [Anatilimnocola floriformis]
MADNQKITPLIDRYAAGAELLKRAVSGMTREQVAARPVAGKWSTLEVVAHIADFEVIGVDRLAVVIAETDPSLPGRDEQQYIPRLAYEQRNFDEQLQLIDLLRRHMTSILRTLDDSALARRGIHSEAGPLTLEQLLERVSRHIEHHVVFIHEKRQALGLS